MRQSFEAGGTQLWGVEYEPDSESEMLSLAPIKENEEAQDEEEPDQHSVFETNSVNDSITASMTRRQSELRSNLLRHKQLWQKAAKQAKQGNNVENRRRSILEDIGITDLSWKPSIASSLEDEDEEENESVEENLERTEAKDTEDESNHMPAAPVLNHMKVLPVSSIDIANSVKPQLQQDRMLWGFLIPTMLTQFTTKVNESLYFRYYSHKKRKTMMMVNVLYCILLISLYALKILPIAKTNHIDVSYLVRETIVTSVMLILHVMACLFTRKANSRNQLLSCAYSTWVLLALHTQITPITSFVDYQRMTEEYRMGHAWDSFGTWQTSLAIVATFGFLSCIPLRRVLLLTVILIIVHDLSAGILTGLYDISCLPRLIVDTLIMISLAVMGTCNYHLVERTERRAFLEIRTCIASRHTIAQENQNQERLVLSVLPKFIVNDILKEDCQGIPFYNVHLKRYENVSILFADICGFTTLGQKLAPKDLVHMLNDLFANFDKLAKKHKCKRIKLLGDCYEALCGLPDAINDHADNCVEMGLDMIGAISIVREQQNVQCLDMRIGVHSGSVFGGVLGLKKYQFDVYSDDVKTANVMESSGEKGRVHISSATKDALTKEYCLQHNIGLNDAYLKDINLETYFVRRKDEPVVPPKTVKRLSIFERRHTMHSIDGEYMTNDLQTKMPVQLRQSTNNAVNHMLLRATDSKADDTLAKEHINTVTLTYKDRENEKTYRNSQDDAFQINTLSFAVIVTVVMITQIVSNGADEYPLYRVSPLLTALVLLLISTFLISILLYRYILYCKYQRMLETLGEGERPVDSATMLEQKKHSTMPRSFGLRNLLITLALAALFLSTIFQPVYDMGHHIETQNVCYEAYMCLSWLLVMLSTASFLKWIYAVKVTMIVLMSVASVLVYETKAAKSIAEVYGDLQGNYTSMDSFNATQSVLHGHITLYTRVEYIVVILFSGIVLVYYFRVLELHARLDFLWRVQAKQELDEMTEVRGNNGTLLRNILPDHVANDFLARKRKDEELYCESYNNVAVMFASICNFHEFWLAVQANGHGFGCLMILNEIITDFDELLTQPAFLEVEKIKTIGSTYMTCVGLSPIQKSENNVTQNLKTCVDLAFEMQRTLAVINQNAFNNDFQIRVGINHGPVVAGVIGARKPHYDIWGHTVNVASRMESNCAPGEVLVMESTANIMSRKLHYPTRYKDTITVKGLALPQRVYTVAEPSKSIHVPTCARMASLPVNSFENLVCRVLGNPEAKRKVREAKDIPM